MSQTNLQDETAYPILTAIGLLCLHQIISWRNPFVIKRWIIPEPLEGSGMLEQTGLSPLLCRILERRGFDCPEKVMELLEEDCPLSDPFAIQDMDKAVERIHLALERGERIAVFGDYDCDGITSTVLLVAYLQAVGGDVFYYVPAREGEGYGLSTAAVEQLAQEGANLIITVDNGISAHAEVELAASLGMDVVITDHHTPRETLPAAVAVLNPHRADDQSGLTELSGVGVTLKLLCALEGDPEGWEILEYYSDLAMIGTTADVVPLVRENRRIVRQGLAQLAQTGRAGLAALLDLCGLEGKPLTAETVAFLIAPRLNAPGRMSTVDDVIELLLTDDVGYAQDLAREIDQQNTLRKQIEEDMMKRIHHTLKEQPQLLQNRLLLVAGEDWHSGVMGIVASKLMEQTGKPVVVFSLEGDMARGSARSLPGFSIIEAVSACSEHLMRYGGHPLAAGMSLPREHLADFMDQLEEYARLHYPRMPHPSLEIDALLTPAELTVENIGSLSALEPYGAGNKPPLFLLRKLTILGIYPTADGRHIRISLAGGGASFTAIYFKMTQQSFPYISGDVVDLVASVSLSSYNGKDQVSVIVRDIRRSGIPQEEILWGADQYASHLRGEYHLCNRQELLPSREDMALVYRYLRANAGFRYKAVELYYRLMDKGISYAKMLVALDVLKEMELITTTGEKGERGFFCRPHPPKVNLDDSAILTALRNALLSTTHA